MKRLASGKRILSAKDDAANLSVANRLKADIVSKAAVLRNLSNGISYSQTAEGALNSVQDLLTRGRNLAVQAANEPLSDEQQDALNEEFTQVKSEIEKIANSTVMFGKHPLLDESTTAATPPAAPGSPPASFGSVFPTSGYSVSKSSGIVPLASLPTGAQNVTITLNNLSQDDDIEIFTKDGKHLVGTDLTDYVWSTGANNVTPANVNTQFITTAHGFDAGATYDASNLNSGGASYDPNAASNMSAYNGMNIGYSGDPDRYETPPNNGTTDGYTNKERFSIDNVTQDLLVFIVGGGSFEATATWTNMPGAGTGGGTGGGAGTGSSPPADEDAMKILAESTYRGDESMITIPKTPCDTATLGLDASVLKPPEEARNAMDALDRALGKVGDYFATYGSANDLLRMHSDNLQVEVTNEESSKSAVEDADMAKEVVEYTKNEILCQAGASVLTQANTQPQTILPLLTR